MVLKVDESVNSLTYMYFQLSHKDGDREEWPDWKAKCEEIFLN